MLDRSIYEYFAEGFPLAAWPRPKVWVIMWVITQVISWVRVWVIVHENANMSDIFRFVSALQTRLSGPTQDFNDSHLDLNDADIIKAVWKPDTYFPNAKQGTNPWSSQRERGRERDVTFSRTFPHENKTTIIDDYTFTRRGLKLASSRS